jgi:hypothetical protein
VLVDTSRGKLIGAGLEGGVPGHGAGRVVAAVDIVVVQDGRLISIGARSGRSTRSGGSGRGRSSKGGGLRSLRSR